MGGRVLHTGLPSVDQKKRPWLVRLKLSKCLGIRFLLHAWHDFHEIAGAMAIIQLPFQNTLPSISASAGRAR